MPMTGEVIEFNDVLEDDPELVNSSPYDEGWMIKVKIADESELKNLLNAEDYKALIGA
jgi:glycine cleavage system H protein